MVVDGEVQADIGPVGAFVSFVVAWIAHRSGMAWWEIALIFAATVLVPWNLSPAKAV